MKIIYCDFCGEIKPCMDISLPYFDNINHYEFDLCKDCRKKLIATIEDIRAKIKEH